jgi:hypothetical protein
VGRVALWGRVVEHEEGYRAQRAYPQMLYVLGPAGTAARLASRYGVEAYPATWEGLEEQAIHELAASPPPAFARSLRRLRLLRSVLSSPRLWKGSLGVGAAMMMYGVWGIYRSLRYGTSDFLTPLVFRILYASWIMAMLASIIGIPNLSVRGYEFELFVRSQRRDTPHAPGTAQ